MEALKGRRDIRMSRKRGEDRKEGREENDGGEEKLKKDLMWIAIKTSGSNHESSAALIWNVVLSRMTKRSFWLTRGSV